VVLQKIRKTLIVVFQELKLIASQRLNALRQLVRRKKQEPKVKPSSQTPSERKSPTLKTGARSATKRKPKGRSGAKK
jgi:hypothetical protein